MLDVLLDYRDERMAAISGIKYLVRKQRSGRAKQQPLRSDDCQTAKFERKVEKQGHVAKRVLQLKSRNSQRFFRKKLTGKRNAIYQPSKLSMVLSEDIGGKETLNRMEESSDVKAEC